MDTLKTYLCETCGGELEENGTFGALVCPKCERDKKKQKHTAFIKSQLPPCLREASFDNYKPINSAAQKTLETCKNYAENFIDLAKTGASLLLAGSCGTGKGHLAAAICLYIAEKYGIGCSFEQYIELISQIKTAWKDRDNPGKDEYIINNVRNIDLLVLDEIGVQFDTEAEKIILYRILNYRYEYFKPTILTTNLSMAELQESIRSRLIDRLFDYRRGNKALIFNWPSYRRACSG